MNQQIGAAAKVNQFYLFLGRVYGLRQEIQDLSEHLNSRFQ